MYKFYKQNLYNYNKPAGGSPAGSSYPVLQQENVVLPAGFDHVAGPDGGVDFADVGAAQHQHTQTALADTAADGVGQLAGQQLFVVIQLGAILTA